MKDKIKITKFNNEYNIIKIYRGNLKEFYLEKKLYGNLFYICGVYDDINLPDEYIEEIVNFAENKNFWS